MSILTVRAPSAKTQLRYHPGSVRVEVEGVSFDARSIRLAGSVAEQAVHLHKINGQACDAVIIMRTAGQTLCSCRLGQVQNGCPHVAAAKAAGMLNEPPPSAGSSGPAKPVPGPVFRSLGDACRNHPWCGYTEDDFEEMARFFGEN